MLLYYNYKLVFRSYESIKYTSFKLDDALRGNFYVDELKLDEV